MPMNLLDIIKRYLRIKDSGLLSIKVEGESHLLKIYLDNGEVVSLSLGSCKDDECLKRLEGLVPVEHFFMRGVRSPSPSKVPLTERLAALTGTGDSESVAGPMTPIPGLNIKPETIAALEEEFIDLIGPIGRMMIENIFSELSYKRGNPMSSEDYSYLLESLIKELPAQQQALFGERYGMGRR
jgi:hypothetical protein